ncbi:C-terminal helicase domain-containing protein, partial [Rhizobium sp. CCGE 510]|uniref:C-terminal helicase domain-containing protein n=1 Tax=Rhizobium sp. CCGE 510 TaxID=1132836 RepID=UPI00027B8056
HEDRAFPKHETTEFAYHLSDAHRDFQEAVLDYCFGIVCQAGSGQREQRLAFWGTLALMRCVGSSPAAALSALRNRMSTESDRLEPKIYDDDGDDEDAVDIEPGTPFDVDPGLLALVQHAEVLVDTPDPKLAALIETLTPIIKKGVNPVVFCRYVATAEYVRNCLRKAFPKLTIESVTGILTPDERRDRVADMAPADEEKPAQRLLVATDCLSEGINLQQLFDTVVHYDLSWNPTR